MLFKTDAGLHHFFFSLSLVFCFVSFCFVFFYHNFLAVVHIAYYDATIPLIILFFFFLCSTNMPVAKTLPDPYPVAFTRVR
jgi:hypothetical protein